MEYAIGVDIGGTKIETALVNNKGKIIHSHKTPTQSNKPKRIVLNNISSAINNILLFAKKNNKKIKGIGIGVPGTVYNNKKIGTMPNVHALSNFDLNSYLKTKFKKKIKIDNDANCFALAEAFFGAGKNKKIVVGAVWGTGFGCGIVINKKVFKGNSGIAGEPGLMLTSQKSKVSSGNKRFGDFESFCSGANLVKHYNVLKGKNKNINAKLILDAKDPISKKVATQAVYYLSLALSHIVHILDPGIIVMGGGISNMWSKYIPKINIQTKKLVDKDFRNTFKVVKNKLGYKSGVVGAASLIFSI